MGRDRILGLAALAFGDGEALATERRIDWLAAHAAGPRVLEIGCREGSLSILLARRGFEVIGTDESVEAIEAAACLQDAEMEPVRSRLCFVAAAGADEAIGEAAVDTVVSTTVLSEEDAERALDLALGTLRAGGRVVLAARRWLETPRSNERGGRDRSLAELIAILRPRIDLRALEYQDRHLLLVGTKDPPREESWSDLGSDARLFALSEACLRDLAADHRRRLERAERVRRALVANIAQSPRKLERELREARRRIADREEALNRVFGTTIYRLGAALLGAARPSAETLRLPRRLLDIYRSRGERRSIAGERPPAEIGVGESPGGGEERRQALDRRLSAFLERVRGGGHERFVVMFSGTPYIDEIRANRPIRFTRVLRSRGVPVLFSYHGALADGDPPGESDPLLLQCPVDYTTGIVASLAEADLGAALRIFVVSYPHRSVPRFLNRLNTAGWVTLYDCRDDWEAFAQTFPMAWYSRAAERFILNNADVSFCVSRPLRDRLVEHTGRREVVLLPNAYDRSFVSPGYAPARDDRAVKIGYFGDLNPAWFDWDAVARVAAALPSRRFEIIGPGAPPSLALPANVHLLGPKRHAEICDIAREWHAAIIPFKIGRLADGVDPIKIYEYLALELPVVSFRMPQIDDYPYTRTVATVDEFVLALEAAVRTECDKEVVSEFLGRNAWEDRVETMLRFAGEAARAAPFEKTLR